MKPIPARSRFFQAGTFILGAAFALGARAEDGPKAVIVNPTTPEQLEVQRIGEVAINRLAVSMTNEVKSALRGGDLADAVDFCHLKDLPTTPGAMIRGIPQIIAIKFTSLKTRGPENLPDPSDKMALESIQQALNGGGDIPTVVVQRIDIPDRPPEWRVYKPIATSASCLACHGNPADQSPRLQAKLKALYPNDEATGYKDHEWRGVIRVTVADGPAQ